MRTKQYLSAEDVTKLARVRAKQKRLGKVEKKLTAKVLEKMQKGYRCPASTPYLLELNYQERTTLEWRKVFIRFAAKELFKGDREAAEKLALRLEAKAPKESVGRILVKANPAYEDRMLRRVA